MSLPKVDPLDHHGGPFMTLDACHQLEGIFNVAMTPIPAFDGGNRGDI
jgi:hypothetical protein